MSKITQLSGKSNEKLKLWRSLLDSRGVKKNKMFLMAGRKTVPEALERKYPQIQSLLFYDKLQLDQLPNFSDKITLYQIEKAQFKQLDEFGTNFPLLVGKVPEICTLDMSQAPDGLELCLSLGDPANLGAVIRTAMGLGVSKIILLAEAAHPYHPKALRTASGTTLNAPIYFGPTIQDLDDRTLALDMQGENIFNFKWPQNVRLVVGEEGPGLGNLNAHRLAIPMNKDIESLSAPISAAIAMAQYRKDYQ